MKVSSIIWETDGIEQERLSLPYEVEVEDGMDEDDICDYLSDTYGFLVISFSLPMNDNDRDYFGEKINEIEGKCS